MKNRRRSVLIAESNRAVSQLLRMHLERAGFLVFVAHDGEQAAILAARQRYELMITNIDLPIMNGAEFCRHVREDLGLTEVNIAVCCPNSDDAGELVFRYGVARVFHQPIDPDAVVKYAKEAVEYLVQGI